MGASYLEMSKREMEIRAEMARELTSPCELCPRRCGVDRLSGERGFCKTPSRALISSYNLHFGEESPLVGTGGSGTIFFSGCNLGCVFCQNYEISHFTHEATEVSDEDLARIMLLLQEKGAHNINLVSPTHVVPHILSSLSIAVEKGLTLPLVYNTGSYDSTQTLGLLDGIVDIYLPDTKVFSSEYAEKYLHAVDYPEVAMDAISEMYRQVGDLVMDDRGVAIKGLLVRHLLMPDDIAGTRQWLEFIATSISPHTYLNIMDQYRPCGEADRFPELMVTISPSQVREAKEMARAMGFDRLDERDISRLFFLLNR